MTRKQFGAVLTIAVMLLGAAVTYFLARPDTSPAPATKQALAAVAVDVFDIDPSSYDANPRFDVAEPLGVVVRWHPDGSTDAHRLHLLVEPDAGGPWCPETRTCDSWETADGEFRLTWQLETPESDPGMLDVSFTSDGEKRSVSDAGREITGNPREQEDLPISVDELAGLLTDPRFSATTTQEMVDTELDKWPEDAELGDPAATTPAVVAQWMRVNIGDPPEAGPADISAYGADAVGAEFRFRDRTTTAVIVPHGSDDAPTCEPGWSCSKPKEQQDGSTVTTGWQPSEVRIFIAYDDRTVVATVVSDRIDKFPKPAWKHKGVGRDVEGLANSHAPWSLTTTKQVAESPDEPWFDE